MSQENVEIVRAVYAALNRGDFDAVFKHAAPDAEVDMSLAIGTDRGVYRFDQFRRLSEEFANSWESVRYEADEIIEAGDQVVTPWTNRVVGRDGIELEARGIWLWTFRNGSVVRLCLYQELNEALEAARLRE
jgi:ketosteroid isomerase-like protein